MHSWIDSYITAKSQFSYVQQIRFLTNPFTLPLNFQYFYSTVDTGNAYGFSILRAVLRAKLGFVIQEKHKWCAVQ